MNSMTTDLRWINGAPTQAARVFLAAVLVLVGLGLVLLFSASSFRGSVLENDPLYFMARQGQGLVLGLLTLVVCANVNPSRWLNLAPWFLAMSLILLIAVFLPAIGVERNGARRWLDLGVRFQPSELTKIALPLFIAWTLHRFPFLHLSARDVARPELEPWRARWRSSRGARFVLRVGQMAIIAIFGALIAIEPDWGTSAFVMGVSTALLIVTRLPWPYIVTGLASSVPVGFLALRFRNKDELLQRFNGFLEPESVYQVWQSLLAIGSGGWFGKGIGNGSAKTLFLPEEYNDFIFAVISEETGFLGACVLIVLFSVLLQAGWRVARSCPHPALRLFGLGIVLNLVLQAAINIAVATASAPTKGIGLPFISYGSTSLSIALAQVGMLFAISRVRTEEVPR